MRAGRLARNFRKMMIGGLAEGRKEGEGRKDEEAVAQATAPDASTPISKIK